MRVERVITETDGVDIIGVTLLSVDEAERLPSRLRERAHRRQWLRSPGFCQNSIAYIDTDGDIDEFGINTSFSSGAVCPVLLIKNLDASNFKIGDTFIFGDMRFEIIDDELAFCLGDIGTCAFREDWRADDANDYDKSDVKKFVDDWFNRVNTKTPNEERMAIWKYDAFPYLRIGKVKYENADGTVAIKGYDGYLFNPIKVMPYDEETLDKFNKCCDDYYQQVNEVKNLALENIGAVFGIEKQWW